MEQGKWYKLDLNTLREFKDDASINEELAKVLVNPFRVEEMDDSGWPGDFDVFKIYQDGKVLSRIDIAPAFSESTWGTAIVTSDELDYFSEVEEPEDSEVQTEVEEPLYILYVQRTDQATHFIDDSVAPIVFNKEDAKARVEEVLKDAPVGSKVLMFALESTATVKQIIEIK